MHFIIAVDNLFIKLNELKRQYKKIIQVNKNY